MVYPLEVNFFAVFGFLIALVVTALVGFDKSSASKHAGVGSNLGKAESKQTRNMKIPISLQNRLKIYAVNFMVTVGL